MKILILDTHEFTRAGMAAYFKKYEVIEAWTVDRGVKALKQHPDVIVSEVHLDVTGGGFQVLNQLRLSESKTPFLFHSFQENVTFQAKAVALGADGFLSKNVPMKDVADSLTKVLAGNDLWDRAELRRITGALATNRVDGCNLTKRELDVLNLLSRGLTNKVIATGLGISYETVKEHVQHILKKLGVDDRTQAAVWAVRQELVK